MHTLIVGMSESGKSSLAKIIVRQLRKSGRTVVVLDPLCDPAWQASFTTDDPYKLAHWMRKNREAFIFIDECGEVFDEGRDRTHSWFATRSRHYGHSVTFIAQRVIMVPRTMRDQCSRLYLFTSAREDGEALAMEWNKDELLACNTLPQYYFHQVSKFEVSRLLKVQGWNHVVPASLPRTPISVGPIAHGRVCSVASESSPDSNGTVHE